MSQSDVERFIADLKNDEKLRNELSSSAAGIGSVVAFAESKGYDVSAEETADYIQSQAGRDLSDEQLDAIAGGKGHHHHNVLETTTNVETTVEAVTEAVAEAAAAVEVAAAAVAVVVAT